MSRQPQPEQITLLYRHRSGLGGEWEDVEEPVPLTWTACNFGGRARGLRVPERAAVGGWQFSTDRDATSCVVIATISSTRASGRTRCTVLFAGRRRFGKGSEGART